METSEIRKQTLILLIGTLIIIVSLIFLSFIEPTIKDYAMGYFERNAKRQNQTVTPAQPEPVAPPAANQTQSNGKSNSNGSTANSIQPDLSGQPPISQAKKEEVEATQVASFVQGLLSNIVLILKILLWFALIILIVRFLNSFLFRTALRGASNYELAGLIKSIVNILIYIIAFFVIFKVHYPLTDLGAFFTTSTIIGVVIGLALQDTLGNLFAGFALQADQPFQIGDVIMIPNTGNGVVESISWRGLKLRTFQNKLIIISNSVLGKVAIEVAPRENLNAYIMYFNTLYSNSPTKTIDVITEVVRQTTNVSPKIRPKVRIKDLGADGIDWEVKYWLEDYSKYNATNALIRKHIWYAFQRESIHFAYPTRTLYMKTDSPEAAFSEDPDEIFDRLNNIPMFQPLSRDEVQKMARASTVRVFAPDEYIVRQGQNADSMFIIKRGSVNIQIREDGRQTKIGELNQGDFFGEMGLFTGEKRTADVIADRETEVLEINHQCLKPILEDNPELVEGLSEIIDQRRADLDKLQTETMKTAKTSDSGVVNSIRKFFGLSG